jgi:hypothetical protein
MNVIWGAILTVISSLGWLMQAYTSIIPTKAAQLGMTEPEDEVDATFYADVRAEAYWDAAILWPLPVAGILLIFGSSLWAYFGLVGGGMFLYFAGRGIIARKVMQRRNIAIGSPESVKVAILFLALWGLVAIIAIVLAIAALPIA